jgi:ribonuclease VapC
MFIDASAIVAIITRESEAARLLGSLAKTADPITAAVAIFEATAGIARKRRIPVDVAQSLVEQFLVATNIRTVAISGAEAAEAIAAFARYGKGRGHPAQLNLGDCFAYASAKMHGVPLLFVGNVFSKTDIEIA